MRRIYPRSRIDEYYEGDHMPPTAVHYFWLRPYSTVCLGDCGGSLRTTVSTITAQIVGYGRSRPIVRFSVSIRAEGE